jgi:hypothetical protein
MNTLELNNVEISDKLRTNSAASGREVTIVDKLIDPVIQRLATLNPLWRFVATESVYYGDNQSRATAFSVVEHGEELGVIERYYHGREYVIHVCNERIGKERVRRGGYKTSDADKAILKAKKMFYKRKPSESLENAVKLAHDVIHTQERRKKNEKYNHEVVVRDAAVKFILGTGFNLFLNHIETWAEIDRNRITKASTEMERISTEMLTIEKVRHHFEHRTAAVVVKDGGKYLVKVGDDVQLYDDNSLPETMRGRLGMLKLVEAEYFIENVGCRVNDEVFVVLMDEETP